MTKRKITAEIVFELFEESKTYIESTNKLIQDIQVKQVHLEKNVENISISLKRNHTSISQDSLVDRMKNNNSEMQKLCSQISEVKRIVLENRLEKINLIEYFCAQKTNFVFQVVVFVYIFFDVLLKII